MAEADRKITSITCLKSGDYVLVERDREYRFSGYIEMLAPGLGLVWISDPAGYRRLIDPSDFILRVSEGPASLDVSTENSNINRPEIVA